MPGPEHPDNRTWAGDSWRTGGAPTWITGAYDPVLDLVYWDTGNPGPDWNGDVRMGDNLYSDSALAVDAEMGELKWYFQFYVQAFDGEEMVYIRDEEYVAGDQYTGGGQQFKHLWTPMPAPSGQSIRRRVKYAGSFRCRRDRPPG